MITRISRVNRLVARVNHTFPPWFIHRLEGGHLACIVDPRNVQFKGPWFDIRTSYLQWLEATWIKFRVLPVVLVLVHTLGRGVWRDTVLQIQEVFKSPYTRSQGEGWTQMKHSYSCNYWNRPQGLYTMSQGWKWK